MVANGDEVAIEQRRECPLCGESMRRVERESIDLLPGSGEVKRTTTREWVCPECDYFEEVEPESRPRFPEPADDALR